MEFKSIREVEKNGTAGAGREKIGENETETRDDRKLRPSPVHTKGCCYKKSEVGPPTPPKRKAKPIKPPPEKEEEIRKGLTITKESNHHPGSVGKVFRGSK